MRTYREIYVKGCGLLQQAGIEEAMLDARILLEYVCKISHSTFLAHGDREVTAEEEKGYLDFIKKRAKRIPLQHITGESDFMGMTFLVDEHVLIPRQDTEILVEEAMRELHDGMRILDMCTGSGCILLSLLRYSNDCLGVGVDLSKEALTVAEKNYVRLKEQYPYLEAEFMQSDLYEKLPEDDKFDMIVSNPPYIRTSVIETLMPEVKDHEPFMALDGREDGLYFYRKITEKAADYLLVGGMIFYEIGYDQAAAVVDILQENGFTETRVIKDYAGLDRVVCGTLSR